MQQRLFTSILTIFALMSFTQMKAVCPTPIAGVCKNTTTLESYETIEAAIDAVSEGQTIQLLADIELTAAIDIVSEKNFTLDLNNHVLKQAGTDRVISNNGTLTIIDNADAKTAKYFSYNAETYCWTLTDQTTEYFVNGGVITGGNAYDGLHYGGAIHNGGTLNFVSGNICGNYAFTRGGAIYNYSNLCNTTISGGKISFNTAKMGGAISNECGSVILTGGEISNNIATWQGGGLYCDDGCTVGGTAIVKNNLVNCKDESRLNIVSNLNTWIPLDVDGPATGMDVGVTLLNGKEVYPVVGQFTQQVSSEDIKDYFFSDESNYEIIYNSDGKYLEFVKVVCKNITTNTVYTTLTDAIGAVAEGETIQLLKNIDLTEVVTISSETPAFTLDLNGYVLKQTAEGVRALDVAGTLTIKDSKAGTEETSFTLYEGNNRWSFNQPDPYYHSITVYDGCITGNGDTDGGGIIVRTGANLTLESGTICASSYMTDHYAAEEEFVTDPMGNGGGVLNMGTFTMTGGTICGNEAICHGGGLQNLEGATATITGGYVKSNTSICGGGISNYGTMKLTGGQITDNDAKEASGVYNASTGLTVGGTVSIVGNSFLQHLEFSYDNLETTESNYIIIGADDDAPAEGMYIGITKQDGGQFTTELTTDYASYFISDHSDLYYVKFNETGSYLELVSSDPTPSENVCVNTTTWTEYETLDDAIAEVAEGETIQLIDNIDLTEAVNISSETPAFTLDLNDHVLRQKAAADRVIFNEGTLTIVDNTEEKTTKYFSYNNETSCWTLTEEEETEYRVTGGVITGGTTNVNQNGHGAGILNLGTLTINSGNICGNHTNTGGGGIGNYDTNCETIVNGGTIAFNTAYYGGGLSNLQPVAGKMTLKGGTITNNIATSLGGGLVCAAGNTVVGGTVVINNNTCNGTASNISTLVSLQIDNPQDGMIVGVTLLDDNLKSVAGQFTTNGSETDADYFFSDNDDYAVAYDSENNYLKLVSAPYVCMIVETSTSYTTLLRAIAEIQEGYTIKMLRDIKVNSTVTISSKTPAFILDLNNYVLSATAGNKAIINNGDLTIVDNADVKTTRYLVQDDETDLWSFTNEVTENSVSGGCIYGCHSTNEQYEGGAIYNAGTLTLKSGNICGNSCIDGESGHGGGISNLGQFTMNGGNICYNVSGESSGGVAHEPEGKAFTMTGGSISYNSSYVGGGMCSETAPVSITGGTISHNKAYIGGGIMIYGEPGEKGENNPILGGTVKIEDNTGGNFAILTMEGCYIKIGDDATEGMSVGVTVIDGDLSATSGQFTTTNCSATDKNYFTSDDDEYLVTYNENGYLELIDKNPACKIVETNIEYASIAKAIEAIETSGTSDQTIQLLKNNKLNDELQIGDKIPAFTLDLAGFVLKQTGSEERVINNYGTLTIMDSKYNDKNYPHYLVQSGDSWNLVAEQPEEDYATVYGGCITGGNISDKNGGSGILNNGTLTLKSGIICGNITAYFGGGIGNNEGATLNISGGTITLNNVTDTEGMYGGGGIANAENGICNISGTTQITSNSSFVGGGILSMGTLTITGGEISNNTAYYVGGGVGNIGKCTLGGTTNIINNTCSGEASNFVTIPSVVLDSPASDMYVGITLVDGSTYGSILGQFTENANSTDAYYFTSDNENYIVSYNSKGYLELIETPKPLVISVTSVGKATVYSDKNLVVPEGVTCYGMTYDSQRSKLVYSDTSFAEDDIIKGRQGYLIEAKEGNYEFAYTDKKPETAITSELKGVLEDTSCSKIKDVENDATIYVLNVVKEKIGFYRLQDAITDGKDGSLAANRAYFALSAGKGVKMDFIGFNDDVTDIDDVDIDNDVDNVYNIQGVKVDESFKGVVIQNGKKIFKK